MDKQFWHNAWARSDRPGWQQDVPHAALIKHWLVDHSTVFVPLCGRSPDLEWIQQQGHTVIGVELSESAVVRFFDERGLSYRVQRQSTYTLFTAERYLIYVGDFFALTSAHLEGVTKVYDRAAMVAMSAELRSAYMQQLQKIVPDDAELFVILLEYDQSLMKGPPFSVTETEFRLHFEQHYRIVLLEQEDTDFKRRGVDHAVEKYYRLTCKKA